MFEIIYSALTPVQWIVSIAVFSLCAGLVIFHFFNPFQRKAESENTLSENPPKNPDKKHTKEADSGTTVEDLLSTYPPFNRRGSGLRVVKHDRRRNHTLFDETDPYTAAVLGALSALSALVDTLAKERRKELTERNNERFSIALDYLIDFEQLLARDPIPNLLELNAATEEQPVTPVAILELMNRKAEPEILQQELLKLSQSMLPLIKNDTPRINLQTVLERFNTGLQEHDEDEQAEDATPLVSEKREDVFL